MAPVCTCRKHTSLFRGVLPAGGVAAKWVTMQYKSGKKIKFSSHLNLINYNNYRGLKPSIDPTGDGIGLKSVSFAGTSHHSL